MPNQFYQHSTYPASNSQGTSAGMRAELDAVSAGFDLLPDPLGVGRKGFLNGEWDGATLVGGTLNNMSLGATTPKDATVTTLNATGLATLGAGLNLTGDLNVTGNVVVQGANRTMSGTLSAIASAALKNFAISGGSIDSTPIGANTPSTAKVTTLATTGNVLIGDGSAATSESIQGPAGTVRGLYVNTGASKRWGLYANIDGESGSNAGSTLALDAFDDSGLFLGNIWTANRASQILSIAKRPLFNGLVPFDSGNIPPYRNDNLIINPEGTIGQRGGSVDVTTTAGTQVVAYGGPDRYAVLNGGGGTVRQSQIVTTVTGISMNAIQQKVIAAATNLGSGNQWSGIIQAIANTSAYKAIGRRLGISFWFQATVPGQYSVVIRDGGNTTCFVTTINVQTANTWAYYTIVTPPVPLTANMFSGTGGIGFQVQIGALNFGTYQTAASPNAWVNGVYIAATGNVNWAATVNATINVTRLRVELDAVTTYVSPDLAEELRRCKYFYQIINGSARFWATVINAFMNTALTFEEMRVIPTVAIFGGTYNNLGSTPTFSPTSTNSGRFEITSGTANNDIYALGVGIALSAEL